MAVTPSFSPSMVAFMVDSTHDQSDERRCTFSRKRRRWTLQANCELTDALTLPRDVSLDGAGHTMTLAGDAERFGSAAIQVSGGDIANLTVDGGQLLPLAPAYFSAIALAAPGRISHTTVRNVRFAGSPHSAIGIEVAAFDGATAIAENIQLESISGTGLLLTGDSYVVAEQIRSAGVTTAVQVTDTVTAKLSQSEIEDAQTGVLAQDQSRVRIFASNSTSERVAADRALIHQETLTFIGSWERVPASRRQVSAIPQDLSG